MGPRSAHSLCAAKHDASKRTGADQYLLALIRDAQTPKLLAQGAAQAFEAAVTAACSGADVAADTEVAQLQLQLGHALWALASQAGTGNRCSSLRVLVDLHQSCVMPAHVRCERTGASPPKLSHTAMRCN